MINLLLPFLISSATSSTTAASLPKTPLSPSNPMNLSNLHYTSTTNTTSPNDAGGIDPRFGVDYQLGSTPLRPTAFLLNAVNAMANLAMLDFDREIPPVIANLPAYPDVVIRSGATASSGGMTPVKYIVWGVWSVALFMMENDVFQTVLVMLGWDGVTVGYLRIEKPRAQVLSLGGSRGESGAGEPKRRSDVAFRTIPSLIILQNSTLLSNITSLVSTDTASTPSNADNLQFFFSPFGRHLTLQQFFTPILAALDYVARFSSTSPVDGFMLRPVDDAETWVEFRDFGTQPKTHAARFEYRAVAKALWEMSVHMALVGYWSEVKVVIQVDGASVGVGWIRLL